MYLPVICFKKMASVVFVVVSVDEKKKKIIVKPYMQV